MNAIFSKRCDYPLCTTKTSYQSITIRRDHRALSPIRDWFPRSGRTVDDWLFSAVVEQQASASDQGVGENGNMLQCFLFYHLCSMLCDVAGGPGEDDPLPGESVEGWDVKEPLREEPTGALDLGRLL